MIFKRVWGAILLGVLPLVSCVQSDLYDDFYDDLSLEELITRRKFKADYHNGGQSNNNQNNNGGEFNEKDLQKAIKWVNENTGGGSGECLLYSIKEYKRNTTLPALRQTLGSGIVQMDRGSSDNWEYWYWYHAKKQGDGFAVGVDGATGIIRSACGVQEVSISSFIQEAKSKAQVTDIFTQEKLYTAPYNSIFIIVDAKHVGLLDRIIFRGNDAEIHLVDQYGNTGPYSDAGISKILR